MRAILRFPLTLINLSLVCLSISIPEGISYGYGYRYPPPDPDPLPLYLAPQAPPPPPEYFGDNPHKRKKRKKVKKKPVGSTWITYLPLGAGQFQNDNWILGGLVASAQVGAAAFWYISDQEADAARRDHRKFLGETGRSQEERIFVDKQYRTYIKERGDFKNYALIGILVTWAGGALEANLNRKMVSRKKKRKRKRFSLTPDGALHRNIYSIEHKTNHTTDLSIGYGGLKTQSLQFGLSLEL